MLTLEIPPNANCDAVDMRIFHDLEPPRSVDAVRFERTQGRPEWCAITGWTLTGQPCPAMARRVDDSGEGVVFLVSGGEAGLRLQPEDHQKTPWQLSEHDQWGAAFLLIGDPADLRFASQASESR